MVVKIITAEGCQDCARAKSIITEAVKRVGQDVTFVELPAASDGAVDLALQFGLEDVPAFVIGDQGFNGVPQSPDDLIPFLV